MLVRVPCAHARLLLLLALPAALACNADDTSAIADLGVCPIPFDASLGKYPVAALPSGGACALATECYLPIDTCTADLASPGGGVNLTEYECLCTDAGWACYAANPENTSCPDGGVADGGGDAGDGATSDAGPTDATTSDGAPSDATVGG